uniref:Uncharacterized protein n=1 Tax=Rhizophora mucronata TaxID=61149 RepID=A0A2P2R093_RHIMU
MIKHTNAELNLPKTVTTNGN